MSGTTGSELVTFRLGDQEFCIDIMAVREIRGWTPTTPLPRAPSFMRGVVNLRGAVLPIIDLAARLGYPSSEPTARHAIMVVQVGGQVVGMLVDAVSDILEITPDMVQPTPDLASGSTLGFVKGLITIDQRMISLIELSAVLPEPQAEAA